MARSKTSVTPGMAAGTTMVGKAVVLESLFTHEAFPVANTPPPPGVVYQVTSE